MWTYFNNQAYPYNPKTAFQFNSCRHVGSKSSPAAPLQAVIYPASLHVFIPDDWLLSDQILRWRGFDAHKPA